MFIFRSFDFRILNDFGFEMVDLEFSFICLFHYLMRCKNSTLKSLTETRDTDASITKNWINFFTIIQVNICLNSFSR